MYMPNAKTRRQPPNTTYIPLEYRLRLLPNAKKSTQKKRNVHGQCKKLASPNARDTNMLVFLALGDAEVLSFALGDAKVPNARYFAFWWNIGLKVPQYNQSSLKYLYSVLYVPNERIFFMNLPWVSTIWILQNHKMFIQEKKPVILSTSITVESVTSFHILVVVTA